MGKVVLKRFILVSILLLLFAPLIQKTYPLVELNPLQGAFTLEEKPDSILENWFSGEYQPKYEKYFNDFIGFRPFFVRFRNQIDFWCFKKSNANKGMIGKDYFLFDDRYIDAYLGNDYIGYDKINQNVTKLASIQKILQEKGKDLIVVFAPGKASFYSDKFPSHIDKFPKKVSNYDTYCELLKKQKINFIDFNKFFLQMKDTALYPLYPKAGYHWSSYGMTLAFDSLVKYIENLKQIRLPQLQFNGVELSDTARDTDYDFGKAMNLLFEIPQGQLAYPIVKFTSEKETKKPKAIVIGDSFYFNFFESYDQAIFEESQFWYYMREVYYHKKSRKKIEEIDIIAEIEKTDLVILISAELNFNQFPYGFIESFDNDADFEVIRTENKIRRNKEWFDDVKRQAIERKVPLDEMVNRAALYWLKSKKNEMTGKGNKDALLEKNVEKQDVKQEKINNENDEIEIQLVISRIKNNKEWYENIAQQAKDRNIGIEEMLRKSAMYTIKNRKK